MAIPKLYPPETRSKIFPNFVFQWGFLFPIDYWVTKNLQFKWFTKILLTLSRGTLFKNRWSSISLVFVLRVTKFGPYFFPRQHPIGFCDGKYIPEWDIAIAKIIILSRFQIRWALVSVIFEARRHSFRTLAPPMSS